MFRRFLIAAPAAAFAAALAAIPALAQDPTGPIPVGQPICGGKFVVDSFYNTVRSDGQRSTVDYMMQVRNTTAQAQTIVVSFMYQGSQNNLRRSANRIQPYQSLTLRLGQDILGNPSGSGALSPQHDVPTMVRINCG
ncbi:MAG: hypothetical protein K2X11_19120 [Acetobacteraceae bacterium]|nr:hypothetical protein [Acetobacteraceae bacterium]